MIFPYMVSIQWGKGQHYFRGGALTFAEASALATKYYEDAQKLRKRRKHKPPQPRAIIWEIRESIQDDLVGPIIWEVEK